MKKEKESLDQKLRGMGINPPAGPAYIPTPAEMRVINPYPGQDSMLSMRDRAMTAESFCGDFNEAMLISVNQGTKTKSTVRIRSSSASEDSDNGKLNVQSAPTWVRQDSVMIVLPQL